MVELRKYVTESNAIENVHDESAIEETMAAWEYLKPKSELTHEVVKSAHDRILRNRQPGIAGEYRSIQVYVGTSVPPPPIVVESEMEKLLSWVPSDPLDTLDWHVAFEQIHPFADGNGRVGRLIYLWHCQQLDTEPILWRADDREGYYALFDSTVELDERID